MARVKKEREAQVIHFSFFDLLFGAFGAFVFLMIMQVLSTINLVDVDFRKAFDQLVQDKNSLTKEVSRLQEAEAQQRSLEEKYRQTSTAKDVLAKENNDLKEKLASLTSEIKAVQDALRNKEAEVDKLRGRDEIMAGLEDENKKLKKELGEARQKMARFEVRPLKIRPLVLGSLMSGQEVRLPLAAEGGVQPYTWELGGKLPKGLKLDEQGGVISGLLESAGSYSLQVQVKDGLGGQAVLPQPITFEVVKPPAEKKEGVSRAFLVMTVVAALLLAYISWGKYQTHKYYKKMIAEGWEPRWIKK